jgi:hypothetical protein
VGFGLSENSIESHLKGQKTRAVVGVIIVTTKIGVQSDRYNPPNPRRVDNSRTQYGVTILSSETVAHVLSVQKNRQ